MTYDSPGRKHMPSTLPQGPHLKGLTSVWHSHLPPTQGPSGMVGILYREHQKWLIVWFETRSHMVAQVGLELEAILLPLPPEFQDHRQGPPLRAQNEDPLAT